jgi:DNA-binding Lrp family transcriptional regulator
MCEEIPLDDIDCKILHSLIRDARTKLKDIAKDCGVSSVTILNRISQLKAKGVITGSILFPNLTKYTDVIMATLGLKVESGKEGEILKLIQEKTYSIEPYVGIGKYDLLAFVTAKNINELEKATQEIRKHNSVKKIAINIWVNSPHMNFENIDL